MIANDVDQALEQLQQPQGSILDVLRKLRERDYASLWRRDSRLYRRFGRELIGAGNPSRALELVCQGLLEHPNDLELKYLRALALARGGNIAKVKEYVAQLLQELSTSAEVEGRLKVDILSLAGRNYKDRYERNRQEDGAREAARWYQEAYRLAGDVFPGINAATMSLLAGDQHRAHELARRIIDQAQEQRRQAGQENDYWLLATLGEAHVILGDVTAGKGWYRKAVREASGARKVGDIAAMRRNLQLLQKHLGLGDDLMEAFHVGRVVMFVGHTIDPPDQWTGGRCRFPPHPDLERKVRAAIQNELDAIDATIGYCSGACGADALFAELMLERGAELHLVLPFALEDFHRTSVDFGWPEMASWRKRFDDILARAAEVHFATTEHFLEDQVLFEFVSDFAQGLVINHARRIGIDPCLLAVREPAARENAGGTVYFLKRWEASHYETRLIDLAALRQAVLPEKVAPADDSNGVVPGRAYQRQIKAMLFADVKNFSKLREEQAPQFFLHFLSEVARVIEQAPSPPDFCNTWGDGLYLVFDTVKACADFATCLLEQLEKVKWEELGLPSDTAIRIGMHAGPVFHGDDPIIGRKNFFGAHVNRAARIEPVTTPGCAFASEQFTALLTVEPGHDFVCEYLGVQPLAKDYDRCPLYRLVRRC